MQTVFPHYYPRFHCIADRCRHSCCIGWEIDIDEASLRRYRKLSGPLGEELRRCISPDADCPHFILTEKERCPFLNEKNLCRLILSEGEGALCQICRDHPRFRNTLAGRTEIGLGLCCEAAADLILGCKEPVHLLAEGDSAPAVASPFEQLLLEVRTKAFAILQNRALPLAERFSRFASTFSLSLPKKSPAEWAALLSSLERLDPLWDAQLAALAACDRFDSCPPAHLETPLEQLCLYLIYRHLPSAQDETEIKAYLSFALLGCQLLLQLCLCKEEAGGCSFADFAELARLYSSEIEYAEDNTLVLLDILWEENNPL